MGKAKVHVLIPFTTQVACGSPSHSITASYRHLVTCEQCKKIDLYKRLPILQCYSKAKGMGKTVKRR